MQRNKAVGVNKIHSEILQVANQNFYVEDRVQFAEHDQFFGQQDVDDAQIGEKIIVRYFDENPSHHLPMCKDSYQMLTQSPISSVCTLPMV